MTTTNEGRGPIEAIGAPDPRDRPACNDGKAHRVRIRTVLVARHDRTEAHLTCARCGAFAYLADIGKELGARAYWRGEAGRP